MAVPERSETLRRVAEIEALAAAWEVVRRNDHAAMRRSAEVRSFGRNLGVRLQELSDALRSGDYRPRPLRVVLVAKRAGRVRELHVPAVPDRVVERSLATALEERLDAVFTPWSFAYRAGLGVDDAVARVVELRDDGAAAFVVRADVADCFPSLDRARLLGRFRELVEDPATAKLVEALLARPVRGRRGLHQPARGVPQGSPLSPLLSNLYLHDVDLGLLARGHPAVRYCDDLTIAAPDRAAADDARHGLCEELTAAGLRPRDESPEVMSFRDGFSFLGETFDATFPVLAEPRLDEPRTLYVHRQGSFVRLRTGQVQVVKGNQVALAVPVTQVGRMVLYGNVSLSGHLRSHALVRAVPVAFMSRRGRWLGLLQAASSSAVALRRRQYAIASNPGRRLPLAAVLVSGKLGNQRALLQRYAHRRRALFVAEAATALEQARRAALDATSIDRLFAIEGGAAHRYFQAYGALLPSGLGYSSRSRRPAKDLVNACLNFGYALLLGEAIGALAAVGLDPAVGIYHATQDGRPSLAVDLMEEFRAPVVDAAVLTALRRRAVTTDDAVTSDDGGVRLSEQGRRRLLTAVETRLVTRFAHVPSGQRTSYRRAILLQARQVAAWLRDYRFGYVPVRWR